MAPVMVVEDFDDALREADATEYGLAAVVLTRSQEHAQRAARGLRAGTLKVNAMFGGAPHPHGSPGAASATARSCSTR